MAVTWATAKTKDGKHAVIVPLDFQDGGKIITLRLRGSAPWDRRSWRWVGWTDPQGKQLVQAEAFRVTPGKRLYRFDGPECGGGSLALDALVAGGQWSTVAKVELAKR